ncbi:glycosyl transferase family 2 [Methanobacterium lacus]|uniref:Glycosyl transferase family 2 n=1 Tax=Methanobacterium lacus (strain AL-21) TaxID=877455 RepID=F0T7H7_METLA|nr:glycosyltransferase family 2 protein [Methanobacterium lacus]ADZ09545.1 glycosyl transferase family 2 [Methanobacterium lacus]
MLTLSAIILNYKDPELTARSVQALLESAQAINVKAQVVVVDNSATETAESLKKLLGDDITLIENRENQGFSRANNQGMEVATGDYILLLNNDAFVNSETLHMGLNYLDNHEKCGVWSPKLVGLDDKFQVSCARLPSLRGLIAEYIQFKNLDWYPDLEKWNEPTDVGNVVGAFMLFRRKLLDEVGMLDEDYFFNVEDVDYCKRIHEAGYEVIYDPRYSVVHIGGASQPGKWVNDPYMHKNRKIYFKKNHGAVQGIIAGLVIWTGLNMRRFMMWRAGEL